MSRRILKKPQVERDLIDFYAYVARDKIEPAERFVRVAEESFNAGAAAALFDLVIDNSSVALHVVNTGIPGDYNFDDIVDAADYVLWRKNDGSPSGYDTWRNHYQTSAGSSNAAGQAANTLPAVPEPFSALLLLLAMLNFAAVTPRIARSA